MNCENINVVIFDMDDTLVYEVRSADECLIIAGQPAQELHNVDPVMLKDSVKKHAKILWHRIPIHYYCKQVGLSSWEALWAEFTGDQEKIIELRLHYKDEYQLAVWDKALQDFNINDKNLAEQLKDRFKVERNKRHILFPETIEVLEYFKKRYRLGLMTNGIPELQWKKINGSGIKDYFEHIFIAGEINEAKPGEKLFKEAMNSFRCEKMDMVIIGNSMKSDIMGGYNFGIRTVWLNWEDLCNDYGISPDCTIYNLQELYDLF